MKQESAETIALQALQWIAANEPVLSAFLASSGASIDDLARNAADPAFLEFVLDFVLSQDALVIGFCDSTGLDYMIPGQARQALQGPASANWT